MGWVLYRRGKLDDAMKHLEVAAELQPQEGIIFEHLGDLQFLKKDFEKDKGNYERAVKFYNGRDKESRAKVEEKLLKLEKERALSSEQAAQ